VTDHKRHKQTLKVICIGRVTDRYVNTSPLGPAVMKSINSMLYAGTGYFTCIQLATMTAGNTQHNKDWIMWTCMDFSKSVLLPLTTTRYVFAIKHVAQKQRAKVK
jgi:hypothetical protein